MSRGEKGSSGMRTTSGRGKSTKRSEREDVNALIEKYETLARSDDAKLDTWIKLGNAYSETSAYDKAVKCYDKASTLASNDAELMPIMEALANTHAKVGNFDKEIQAYTVILKRFPNIPSIWGKASRAYERSGRIQEAVLHYTRAVRANTVDPTLLYHYSFFCEKLGQIESAVNSLERALKLKPRSERLLERLSILNERTHNLEDAYKYRLALLELDPSNLKRWEGLIQVARADPRHYDAIKICQKAIIKSNSPMLWELLGDIYMDDNKAPNALYCYSTAAGLGSKEARAKADELKSKNIISKVVSLHEIVLGNL